MTSLSFDLSAVGIPANKKLLGNNVEWTGLGDDSLLPTDGTTDLTKTREKALNPTRLVLTQALKPQVLRYPGGNNSDLFHWLQTVGGLSSRTNQEVYGDGSFQRPDYGVAEHMALALATGAKDILFTVNIPSGTSQEAADWVTKMNITGLDSAYGGKYPRVNYWEIGNEPYLNATSPHVPSLDMTPAAFIAAANSFMTAMKAVDATIKVGLPFKSDRIGAYNYGKQGYNTTVMAALNQAIDFAALHTAYLPIIIVGIDVFTQAQLFATTMAAYRVTEDDLAVMRTLLDANNFTRNIPFALTEHNSLFTTSGAGTDAYIQALVGALHVANILRLAANRSDFLMLNFWSLSSNFFFGSISQAGRPRPAYYVLQAYYELIRGVILPNTVIGGNTQASIQVGLVPVYPDTPTLGATVSKDGNLLQILLINRDLVNSQTVAITPIKTTPIDSCDVRTFGKNKDVFDTAETNWSWETVPNLPVTPPAFPVIVVPPHSLAWVTIQLSGITNSQVFNTYENFPGCYYIVDNGNYPVAFCFIKDQGSNPQVRFVDYSTPISNVPMVQGGDWIDILIDNNTSSVKRKSIRYLNHNAPQTFVIDVRGASFITIARNRSNPRIHTSPVIP